MSQEQRCACARFNTASAKRIIVERLCNNVFLNVRNFPTLSLGIYQTAPLARREYNFESILTRFATISTRQAQLTTSNGADPSCRCYSAVGVAVDVV